MGTNVDFDLESLIIEVEERPILYNKNVLDYSNKVKKDNVWMDVAEKITYNWENLNGVDKENRSKEIQAVWRNLEDDFRKELQAQRKLISEQEVKKRRKYKYFEQLLFLTPYVSHEDGSEKYTSLACTSMHNENGDNQNITENSSACGSSQPSNENKETVNSLKRKLKEEASFGDELIQVIKQRTSEDQDEDKSFCKSLIPLLKKMNDDYKLEAKIAILKTVHRISFIQVQTRNQQSTQTLDTPNIQCNHASYHKGNIQAYCARPSIPSPCSQTYIQSPYNCTSIQSSCSQTCTQAPYTHTSIRSPCTQTTMQPPYTQSSIQSSYTNKSSQPAYTHGSIQSSNIGTRIVPITGSSSQQGTKIKIQDCQILRPSTFPTSQSGFLPYQSKLLTQKNYPISAHNCATRL